MAGLTEFFLERLFSGQLVPVTQPRPSGAADWKEPHNATGAENKAQILEKSGTVPAGPHGSQMFRPVTDPIMPTATMPKASLPSAAMPQVSQAKTPYAVRTPDQPAPGGTQKRSGYAPEVDTKDISSWDGVSTQAAFGPAGIGATQAAPLPLAQMAKTFAEEATEDREPVESIPTGPNAQGIDIMQNGLSDPWAKEVYEETGKAPEPTPMWKRYLLPGATVNALSGRKLEAARGLGSVGASIFSLADIGNDLLERTGNVRVDLADDGSEEWAPEYEWRSLKDPSVWYTADQIIQNYVIDGEVYTQEEMENSVESGGMVIMPDEREVTRKQYDDAPMVFRTLPDGTVLESYDEDFIKSDEGKVERRQTNANWAGYAEPRMPWQDTSGNDPFIDKDYDFSRWVLTNSPREALDSSIDMLAQSAPYMGPPWMRWGSAAARGLPALMGYDTDTYQKTGDLFEPSTWDDIGDGGYEDKLTGYDQRLAGLISPFFDAWVEKASGDVIGGLENLPRKFLPGKIADAWERSPAYSAMTKNLIGRALLSAGPMEALEEVPSVIPSALARDGAENMGREQRWNPETERFEYYGPWGVTLPREFLQSAAGGGVMGAEMSAGGDVLGRIFSGTRYPEAQGYQAKPAPRMTDEEIEEQNNRSQ